LFRWKKPEKWNTFREAKPVKLGGDERNRWIGYPGHDIHIDTFEGKLVPVLSDFEGESPSEVERPMNVLLIDLQVVITEGS
jgi:hypothetical protein